MDYELVGWPPDGPRLHLDHRTFSYAGKFRIPNTGKAVAKRSDEILAAAAFNEDRTDRTTLRIRTIAVHADHRGRGIGSTLLAFVRAAALESGYTGVAIAVNNPFAYQAAYRGGFEYDGERTGLAELVLRAPAHDRSASNYRAGLRRFRDMETVPPVQCRFLETIADRSPPVVVDPPPRA